MSYFVTFSDKTKAFNVSIDDFIITKPIRNIFKNNITFINDINFVYEQIKYPKDHIYNALNNLCNLSIDNKFRVLLSDKYLKLPFVFKHKNSNIKHISTYYTTHIYSSIIKTVILDGTDQLENKIDKAIYLLYSYWYTKKSVNNIKEITHLVCVSIESIISIIIEKGLTSYKEYNTNDIINILRDRLISEKLHNMGDI